MGAISRGIDTIRIPQSMVRWGFRSHIASQPMRLLLAFPILALGFAYQAAYAQAPAAKTSPPGAPVEKILTPEESTARIEAIRQKSEALQRARDVKLRKTTRSICVGC